LKNSSISVYFYEEEYFGQHHVIGSPIILGGFYDGKYRELYEFSVMYNGIIFQNYKNKESIFTNNVGNSIKAFLEKLHNDGTSKPNRIVYIGKNPFEIKYLDQLMYHYGIEFIGILNDWKNPKTFDIHSLNRASNAIDIQSYLNKSEDYINLCIDMN
jgi:hypothetical protein